MSSLISLIATLVVAPSATFSEEPPSLHVQIRSALSDLHETATGSRFNQLALKGGLTADQYRLHLQQRLATFEVVETRLYQKNEFLPADLRGYFTQNEQAIVRALRQDLGMSETDRVVVAQLPTETQNFIKMLQQMDDYQVATVGYIMCGGSAFGAHDVAKSVRAQLSTENVRGLSVYQFEHYRTMVERLNRVKDAKIQRRMIEAGRKFMMAQTQINNGPEFGASVVSDYPL